MREILRKLLEAEEAGRLAATRLEAAGDEILRRAQAQSQEIVQEARAETAQQIVRLQHDAQGQIELGRGSIAQEADAVIKRLREQAAKHQPEAVTRVVEILLGEVEVTG
ncbi:MAG: hypothetical protein HY000_36180 [Planctomycetes bacterium]|nr:hypothetical protein [Planctomycetota bacterium]